MIVTVIMQIALFKYFCVDENTINHFNINITYNGGEKFYNNNSSYISGVNKKNSKIEQDFIAYQQFNKIYIYAKKENKTNKKVYYKILLKDEDNNLMQQYKVNHKNVKKNFIELDVDISKIMVNKKYKIEIVADDNEIKEDTIKFGYVYSKAIDYYIGNLSVDDEIQPNKDLYIKVSNKQKETYLNIATYITISVIFLMLEYSIYLIIKKTDYNE